MKWDHSYTDAERVGATELGLTSGHCPKCYNDILYLLSSPLPIFFSLVSHSWFFPDCSYYQPKACFCLLIVASRETGLLHCFPLQSKIFLVVVLSLSFFSVSKFPSRTLPLERKCLTNLNFNWHRNIYTLHGSWWNLSLLSINFFLKKFLQPSFMFIQLPSLFFHPQLWIHLAFQMTLLFYSLYYMLLSTLIFLISFKSSSLIPL